MIIIAALGLLIAATGCTENQAGPSINGRLIAAPVFEGAGCSPWPDSAGRVQESSLYSHSARVLMLAETLAACAQHEIACTDQDGRALKASAETSFQDLVDIIASGDKQALSLTADEENALRRWAREAGGALSQTVMPDEECRSAGVFVSLALQLIAHGHRVNGIPSLLAKQFPLHSF